MIATRTQVHLFFSLGSLEFSTYNAALAFRVWAEFLFVVGATLYGFKEKSWQSAMENDRVFATFALI